MSTEDSDTLLRHERRSTSDPIALMGARLAPAYAGGTGSLSGQVYRSGALSTDEAFDRLCAGVGAFLRGYVRTVDTTNRAVGLFAMYLLFAMMAILTYAMVANVIIKSPAIWVMEMAQFTMAAYYLLGGGFSFQDDAHVRMDVFRDRWSPRTKYIVDAITDIVLLFYMGVLLNGAISSAHYALEFHQKNYTAWAPPMAPIKIVMAIGILLMTLQILARMIRDVAGAFGKELR